MNKGEIINTIYYHLKPFIPRNLQIIVRRQVVSRRRLLCKDTWPIDPKTATPPDTWPGWPEQRRFALVLTHDVDTALGQERCHELIELEESMGFRSSFYFVPERYEVSKSLRNNLVQRGFEVGVHGLTHDGKLYSSRKVFEKRAIRINKYLKDWEAVGFRSPAMHHNLDWLHSLNVEYDASTFDTDPFEPQADGMGTIFPFWVNGDSARCGYVELPYTLPQDSTLFVLMKEKTPDIWNQKLDWIVQQGGMALVNVHPDYMNFDGRKLGIEEYPAEYYEKFLEYVQSKYKGHCWHTLPKDMAKFWSTSVVAHRKGAGEARTRYFFLSS